MKNRTLLIVIGIVAALCLCSVVVSLIAFQQLGKQVANSVKTEPAEVAQIGAQIADYTVPAGYTQKMAMSLLSYNFVFIEPSQGSGGMTIMLGQFESIGAETYNQEAFKEQMQRSLEQQSGRQVTNMHVVEVKEMAIRGEEVPVTISEGQLQNGETMRQLVAVFPAKQGMGMIMTQATTDVWDQPAIDQFLKSIH